MLPEIIFLAKSENPLRRNADFPVPDIISLVVVLINGRIQSVLRQTHHSCQKLPAPRNGLALKVIPKGKISQHFKKSAVSCSLAHVLQIARADALLAGSHTSSGRNFLPGKIGLEGRHAGID